jgi:hypothetical protein
VDQDHDAQPGGWTKWAVERGWQPSDISSVQLVVCLEQSQRRTIDTCSYEHGHTVTRQQYSRVVTVIEARTGRYLNDTYLEGGEPGFCPNPLIGDKDQTREGSMVQWDDGRIWDYLAKWVDGPVTTPSPATVNR